MTQRYNLIQTIYAQVLNIQQQGAAPRNLGKTDAYMLRVGAAHRNLVARFIINHTQVLPLYRAFILMPTLHYFTVNLPLRLPY